MQLYLDRTVLMWLRRDFKHPRRREIWTRHIEPLISTDESKILLNLRHGDKSGLAAFALMLPMLARGQTYAAAYRRVAQEIAEFLGQSVVDQLAALVDPPKPKTVKMPKTVREKALKKRMARHE